MHEGDTSGCIIKKEKIKKKKKKNSFQKEKDQSNEIHARVNGCEYHEEIIVEEKSKLDIALTVIERLKNENKNLKTLVQICDEREYEDKEEIVGLKAQLEESRKVEDTLL